MSDYGEKLQTMPMNGYPVEFTIQDKIQKTKEFHIKELDKIDKVEKFLKDNPTFVDFHNLMKDLNIRY